MMNSVPYVASNKGVEVMAQYLPEEVALHYFTDICIEQTQHNFDYFSTVF